MPAFEYRPESRREGWARFERVRRVEVPVNDEPKRNLEKHVARFREWAYTLSESIGIPVNELGGEWECDFEGLYELYESAADLLAKIPPAQWDSETVDLLLYALARDNECERTSKEFAKKPDSLLVLARSTLHSK